MCPQSVLLSEVHPNGYGLNPLDLHFQLNEWYNIPVQKGLNYADYINIAIDYCTKNNRELIIRDFSEFDFGKDHKNKLTNLEYLQKCGEVLPLAIIRDPIDIFISKRFDKSFFENYYYFVDHLKSAQIPKISYEDFCTNPDQSMKEISTVLKLTFNEKYQNFHQVKKMSGDLNYIKNNPKSGSLFNSNIELKDRKKIPYKIRKKLNKSTWLKKCQDITEYGSFETRPISKTGIQIMIELKHLLSNK